MTNNNKDYTNKRALILLRVSTPEQKKGYGWLSQEIEIRKKLIEPLCLILDEDRHIIKDVYTGLEFRNRPALECILEMAGRHEFDILAVDVLDRLGRRALAREIYISQLRELGVHVLTTDPSECADDESLTGEMTRIAKGHQAEEELNTTRRRLMHGQRAKIEGDEENGIMPKIGGGAHRNYGYKFVLSESGKRIGYSLNHDVIVVDEDGTEWTEVKVIIHIFDSSARGITLWQIAKFLNDKAIPTPYVAKGVNAGQMKHPLWQPSSISRITRNSVYYGEARFFKVRAQTNVQGKKEIREKTTEAEQVVVEVPAIITRELAETARQRILQNQPSSFKTASSFIDKGLLSGGLAKCGHCGGRMRVLPHHSKRNDGSVNEYFLYSCGTQQASIGVCKGCSILTTILDNSAWAKAVEIIRDRVQLGQFAINIRTIEPNIVRRDIISTKLEKVKEQQAAMRGNMANLMVVCEPDQGTLEFLQMQLLELARQEKEYEHELALDNSDYKKWKSSEENINELHQLCIDTCNQPDDNASKEVLYNTKRKIIEFLGIHATVWKKDGSSPKFAIQRSEYL